MISFFYRHHARLILVLALAVFAASLAGGLWGGTTAGGGNVDTGVGGWKRPGT